ncbi:class III poly(R)-hydroxyalkanoic acid synthase subunit PhaC [Neptunomonas marina]|uniref:Poly(3-hydroxyalkanoate) polymerase subunit PhaC n=1 Tax=Neptunomonas marina TaxID=1815562 RepID=A0A437QE13_9GAMM|nr:class III poly(R)-hydroxyalkanoic acid synthase subunit PhaC [Neptunomonas marina]RVU32770.1 class III poly(R)-hydroxyalkanoic acid synthase subunit PhaC [Neptunomonas marina]
MSGLKFDAELLETEFKELYRQLSTCADTLAKISAVEVAPTQSESIFHYDKLTLNFYPGDRSVSERPSTPLLICYALVNRWYMLDLDAGRSLIQRLNALGVDIYVIDWGYPDRTDRFTDLDDYLNDYLLSCVEQTCQHAGAEQINLLGVCQGGTLSLCFTALYPERIKNLITMVTPVDFHTAENILSRLVRNIDVDLAVNTFGNIPGSMLNQVFRSLSPMKLGPQKTLDLPKQLQTPEQAEAFLRMERWINDSPDLAGSAYREFVQWFFQQNQLVANQLQIGSEAVRLADIRCPIFNIYGTQDHLVPPCASKALGSLVGTTDYTEQAIEAGHIGVFVGNRARKTLPLAISQWLYSRD